MDLEESSKSLESVRLFLEEECNAHQIWYKNTVNSKIVKKFVI